MCGISPSKQAPRSWLSAATPRSTPLRPPIWPSSRTSSSIRRQLGEAFLVGRGAEDARGVLGMHRGRHRGERVDAFHAELRANSISRWQKAYRPLGGWASPMNTTMS